MVKRTKSLAAVLFLYTLGTIPVNVCATGTCEDCPTMIFGDTNETIEYESTLHNCRCSWPIPLSVENKYYMVVLVLKNFSLPITGEGCTGSLRFPDKTYRCDFERTYCLAYSTQDTECQISETTINNMHGCDEFETSNWDLAKKNIEFFASDKASYRKAFTLQYYPINCPPPTTTPTTIKTTTILTTISTTTTPTTTATSTTTEKKETTTPSASAGQSPATQQQPTSHTTREMQPISTTSSTNSRSTTNSPQRGDHLVSIIVPIMVAILVLLIIGGVLLLRYRKRENQSENQHIKVDELGMTEKATVENAIYDNNDTETEIKINEIYEDSTEPEIKINKIYEDSTEPEIKINEIYVDATEPEIKKNEVYEDACVYAAVDKPKKNVKKED